MDSFHAFPLSSFHRYVIGRERERSGGLLMMVVAMMSSCRFGSYFINFIAAVYNVSNLELCRVVQ